MFEIFNDLRYQARQFQWIVPLLQMQNVKLHFCVVVKLSKLHNFEEKL